MAQHRKRAHPKSGGTSQDAPPLERVKKVFLTRSQTGNALLVSRLKRLASCCAHNLCAAGTQIPHLQDVKCFVRRTRRRAKQIYILFRRARRNSTRFFDRLKRRRVTGRAAALFSLFRTAGIGSGHRARRNRRSAAFRQAPCQGGCICRIWAWRPFPESPARPAGLPRQRPFP